jgi:hypothetical protein
MFETKNNFLFFAVIICLLTVSIFTSLKNNVLLGFIGHLIMLSTYIFIYTEEKKIRKGAFLYVGHSALCIVLFLNLLFKNDSLMSRSILGSLGHLMFFSNFLYMFMKKKKISSRVISIIYTGALFANLFYHIMYYYMYAEKNCNQTNSIVIDIGSSITLFLIFCFFMSKLITEISFKQVVGNVIMATYYGTSFVSSTTRIGK